MSGRQSRIAAEVTEGKNIRFYDTKNGSAISEMYLQNPYGIANTILTNGNGKIYMSDYRFYEQAFETLENNDCKPGDIINAFNRTVDRSGISPTITTRLDGLKTSILPVVEGDNKQMEEVWTNKKPTEGQKKYRIRKLTPRETWRLMGYTDEDFEKAAFEKKELYIQGDNDKCNARLKAVQEKPKHTDMESFVSCIINDTKSMETLKIIKKLLAEMPENEKTQNVNFVITKSEELEHLECAINTTKCITFMGMQCTLTEGKDQLVMVITEQEKEDKQNTGKFMKIITELNSNPLKLYTILILTAQIIKSKIYGSTTLRANIQGNIAITDVCENSILLKISDLKMENTCIRVSSSQLYKQAGNAIVKQVLMAIFLQMGIQGKKKWNEMSVEERQNLVNSSLDFLKDEN